MTDELKLCPCGGEARIVNVTMVGCSYVICTDCRMQSDGGNILGIDRAVAAWNTRADLATPLDDPLVKALVNAAKEVKADCIARADKNGVVPIGRGAWDQLTAALIALEENE